MGSLGRRLTDLEDHFGMSEEAWDQAWNQAMDAALEEVLTPAEKAELARPLDEPRTREEWDVAYEAVRKWGLLCVAMSPRPQGRR